MKAVAALMVAAACGGEAGETDTHIDAGIDAAATSAWRVLPSLPAARQETAVVAIGERVYVLGGFDATGTIVPTVQVLEAGAWSTVAPLPAALHHVNAAVAGGKIYVTGALAEVGFQPRGTTLVYDPSGDRWTALSPMPAGTERGASAVGVIDGVIYVAGGLRGDAVTLFSAYHPADDRWEPLPDLPSRRDHLLGAAVGGVFYVVGGRQATLQTNTGRVDAYDPVGRSWTSRTAMPTARGGTAGGVLAGKIVVVGGEAPGGVFPEVEIYDPATDRWEAGPAMATPRHGMGAAVVGDELIVPGGGRLPGLAPVATVDALKLD